MAAPFIITTMPVSGTVTQGYNTDGVASEYSKVSHKSTSDFDRHGIDFAAKVGTSVYAAFSGTVHNAALKPDATEGYGSYITIKSSSGLYATYGHLSGINVKKGDTIKEGDLIGLSGDTGKVYGAHLHVTFASEAGAQHATSKSDTKPVVLIQGFFTSEIADGSLNLQDVRATDIFGTAAHDHLPGTSNAERIFGGDGNDRLQGAGGADTVYGGGGKDRVGGGDGADFLVGGAGDDQLWGDAGTDTLNGDAGNDVLEGGADKDTLDGGLGNDKINGGAGDDLIHAGKGADVINGGDGTDTVRYLGFRQSDCTVTTRNGKTTVRHKSGTSTVTDTLTFVETLQFDDGIRSLSGGAQRQAPSDSFQSSGASAVRYNEAASADGATTLRIDGNTLMVGETAASLSWDQIRDFDGNAFGNASDWRPLGFADVDAYRNGNNDVELIAYNPTLGRWATLDVDAQGQVEFSGNGQGTTRVAGVYRDPQVDAGLVSTGSATDSATRFASDLRESRLTLIGSTYEDSADDGLGRIDLWFQITNDPGSNDDDVFLRALLHTDGNVQYANYMSVRETREYIESTLGVGEFSASILPLHNGSLDWLVS